MIGEAQRGHSSMELSRPRKPNDEVLHEHWYSAAVRIPDFPAYSTICTYILHPAFSKEVKNCPV